MLSDISKSIKRYRWTNPAFEFLLGEENLEEQVSLHCKASSFDSEKADLRSAVAIRIRDQRILTSSACL
ncbi:hypothetical protein CCP2SC5_1230005 [Azospirillaceae bacterium]